MDVSQRDFGSGGDVKTQDLDKLGIWLLKDLPGTVAEPAEETLLVGYGFLPELCWKDKSTHHDTAPRVMIVWSKDIVRSVSSGSGSETHSSASEYHWGRSIHRI